MPDASPTARALLALEAVQARPGLTAAELAARLGVTERAARRYMATLREAGLPVEAQRGRYGGYRIGRGVRFPPLMLSATEAFGLVMAVLDSHHAADDEASPVGAALGKILAMLPQNVARPAAQLRATAVAAPQRRAARPDPARTGELIDAVAVQQRVALSYRSEGGRSWTEHVDPWAVVVRHGRWYLLCFSHRADGVRTYRLDRVEGVELSGTRFDLPADLDPVASLEDHLGQGWPFETRVTLEASLEEAGRLVPPHLGRLHPLPGEPGRCLLVGSTRNPHAYATEWLAPLPFDFRVEGGRELRAAVAVAAERLQRAASER